MRYGEGLLEEIRRRTDLVQLVGRRVKLIRKGRVMWGCCPFHGEKSPSFKVENERRTYKCFGCGKGGDCFRWLIETEGLSFPESVEKLAAEAGVELPKWSPEDEAREQKRKSLYDIVELASKFYEAQLFEAAQGRSMSIDAVLDPIPVSPDGVPPIAAAHISKGKYLTQLLPCNGKDIGDHSWPRGSSSTSCRKTSSRSAFSLRTSSI